MALFRVILHVAVLFLFFGAGSLLQQWLQLPVPGSIVGMILLFLAFSARLLEPRWIREGTALVLRNMPLIFLPVTVGIMQYYSLFTGSGLWLIIITLASTFIVMALTGVTAQQLMGRKQKHE